MIFVIIEFHALNDVIAEPDTNISMRLDVAWGGGGATTQGEPRDGVKPARQVDFVGRPALDPGPAEPLPAAGEGQMNATRLGLCRTDADEPAVVGSSTSDRDADKSSRALEPYRICQPQIGRPRLIILVIKTATLPGKR